MTSYSRRAFMGTVSSCAAHMALMSLAATPAARKLFAAVPQGRVLARELWGRIEQVGPGLWAMVSTPLAGNRASEAMRTFSNGGIIAGRERVLVVEAFATPEGAQWIAEATEELTGRWPTDVVVTHYHGDHTRGIAGYGESGVRIGATRTTRELLREREPLPDATVDEAQPSEIDLGGRVVRIVPRSGHTASDVTIEVDDPHVLWCGDLVWNGLFPNYVDATPSVKSRHVRELLTDRAETLYVPGHGSLARSAELWQYLALLDDIEEKARAALSEGIPTDEAADAYRLPASFGEWTMFSPSYYRRAFQAWARELGG